MPRQLVVETSFLFFFQGYNFVLDVFFDQDADLEVFEYVLIIQNNTVDTKVTDFVQNRFQKRL